ncbi:hypothetical protein ABE24_16115 [Cytobacillus firmus]|nr:hypothetical protein [Cytobacillus firmus]
MALFIGYHGTNSNTAKNIIRTNFSFNTTKPGWLGSGIYFFEENEGLARYWGNLKSPGNASVLRTEIDVPDDKIFDVSDPSSDHSKTFHAFREQLLPVLHEKQINIKAENKTDFDGKILNMICIKEKYQLVRSFTYTYIDYDRKNGTFSRFPNGIELCLKNNGYIVNKQIV